MLTKFLLMKKCLKSENNKNFEIEKIDLSKNDKIIDKEFFKKYQKEDKYLQVYQNDYTDGFFICKLTKNV